MDWAWQRQDANCWLSIRRRSQGTGARLGNLYRVIVLSDRWPHNISSKIRAQDSLETFLLSLWYYILYIYIYTGRQANGEY